jgi:hypothetical protein
LIIQPLETETTFTWNDSWKTVTITNKNNTEVIVSGVEFLNAPRESITDYGDVTDQNFDLAFKSKTI